MKKQFGFICVIACCVLIFVGCTNDAIDTSSTETSGKASSVDELNGNSNVNTSHTVSYVSGNSGEYPSYITSSLSESSWVTSSGTTSSGTTSSGTTSSGTTSSTPSTPPATTIEKPKQTITLNGVTYTQTFFDDFEGTSLDTTKWSLCPQQNRQDIGGRWSNDCTSLDGEGNLVLTAKKDGNTYKSGAIRSKGKFEQVQGYFEMRAKVQQAPGFWGAFWLLSDSMSGWSVKDNNSATDGIEIDIMESNNIYSKSINTALHWDGWTNTKSLKKEHYPTDCYDGEYHTFSLLWTDTAYIWYIDGVEIYRTQKGWGNYPGCCEDACYIKVTTEFGSWAASPVDSKLPDEFVVDYVVAYQKA